MAARIRKQGPGIALAAASLIAAAGCSSGGDPAVPITSTAAEEAASPSPSPSPSALPEMTPEELRDFMVDGTWSNHLTLSNTGSYNLLVDAEFEILTYGSPDYFDVLCSGPLAVGETVRVTLECLSVDPSDGTASDAGTYEGTVSLADPAGLPIYPGSEVVSIEWDDGRVDLLERRT